MDLSTSYLGLKLKNPVVASAGPFSKRLDSIRQLEDAGVAAVVMYSLFEEQIEQESEELDHFTSYGTDSFAEALSYFPDSGEYHLEPEEYIELVSKAAASASIPIIGSLNGVTSGGWTNYAREIEQAGAAALELNIYHVATDATVSAQEVENQYIDILRQVRKTVKLPIAVKIGPYFSSLPNFAHRLVREGANGLVLFNRFYQPDIDLDELDVKPGVTLSDSNDNRLPMRWIGVLHGSLHASLAASSGIHTAEDVVKLMMVGADCTMMCSALQLHGAAYASTVIQDVNRWLTEHEYESMEQMKGSLSHQAIANPSAYERANYMKALNRFKSLI